MTKTLQSKTLQNILVDAVIPLLNQTKMCYPLVWITFSTKIINAAGKIGRLEDIKKAEEKTRIPPKPGTFSFLLCCLQRLKCGNFCSSVFYMCDKTGSKTLRHAAWHLRIRVFCGVLNPAGSVFGCQIDLKKTCKGFPGGIWTISNMEIEKIKLKSQNN